MGIKSDLPAALKYHAVVIESAARDAGLDFFDVVFELLEARAVNGVAAYGGFPVRYPFWRFGMEFEKLQKGYDWGLSKIYELVVNNDPTYAYLVASNSLLEQKLVMAHVYGHADFFRHNAWFAPTDRSMVDTMGRHSTRVRRYVDAHGQETVERLVDRVLSVESLIDPYLPLRERRHGASGAPPSTAPLSERISRSLDRLLDDPGDEPAPREPAAPPAATPTLDVLGFLAEHAPLKPWERDIVRMLRAEAYYFSPQRMTKVANEGWASFWHSRLLTTAGILDASEILDFADVHSGALVQGQSGLNPYKLGIALFRHAEVRGEDLFFLRTVHNDVSLVDALVDEEFVHGYLRLSPEELRAAEDQGFTWAGWKAQLLSELAWGGQPRIELVEQDGEGAGELVLRHHHDGRDLQLGAAGQTLLQLGALWGAPVHLDTVVEEAGKRISVVDGQVATSDTDAPGDAADEPASPPRSQSA